MGVGVGGCLAAPRLLWHGFLRGFRRRQPPLFFYRSARAEVGAGGVQGGHTAPPDTRRLPTGVLLPDALPLAASASSGKEKKGFSESFSEAFSSSE